METAFANPFANPFTNLFRFEDGRGRNPAQHKIGEPDNRQHGTCMSPEERGNHGAVAN